LQYQAGLNQQVALEARMRAVLDGAKQLHLAAAYVKSSGAGKLLRLEPPPGGRAVVGLGFGISDPLAVEQLEAAGMDVKVVPDGGAIAASQFHPKLYLIDRQSELHAISGSANLTGAAWTTNVEQFEELTFSVPSGEAEEQFARYEQIWEYGKPLALLRRSGDWDLYRQRARDRRRLEVEDRRRLTLLQARTGQLVGSLARRPTRAAPGYVGITNDEWWELQLRLRDATDRALFWRRNTKGFKALAEGGVFFHLVKDPAVTEELRAIRGYSVYPGDYEVGPARVLHSVYGRLLGVMSLAELYDRLSLEVGSDIGIIHLASLTELERPVTLEELRANGISFAQNIVSGKSLTLEEVATIFELGGLGSPDSLTIAAEPPPQGWGSW
jgi:hypothetical protein